MNAQHPRLWQRQPDEAPADFTAFVTYLRLKGRRSHRLVALQTGRPLGSIRRLSGRFNWPSRIVAFETRLADAAQGALDLMVHATTGRAQADFERLRTAEFLLAQRIRKEGSRWLKLASDPHRRDLSLTQICHVIELASKLGRLAAGMPLGNERPRRPRPEDRPGFWTGPSLEEAMKKCYPSPDPTPPVSSPSEPAGSPQPGDRVPPQPPVVPAPAHDQAQQAPPTSNLPPPPAGESSVARPATPRRDVWFAWSRAQRQAATNSKR